MLMVLWKVNETRKRSLLKSITGRIIEVTLGTLIQGIIFSILGFPRAFELGFMTTVIEEISCFCISYLTERLWNKIDWGRVVKEEI